MFNASEEWLAAYYLRTGLRPPTDGAPVAKDGGEPRRGQPPVHAGGEASEEEEQIMLFTWAAYACGSWPEMLRLFHIPNGGHRTAAEAGRFRAMGVKPGVPDVFLPVPRGGYNGLFIELKRRDGGTLSDDQREWLDFLSLQGYRAVMRHGWEAARDELIEYLGR